jgi:hypothetical protein
MYNEARAALGAAQDALVVAEAAAAVGGAYWPCKDIAIRCAALDAGVYLMEVVACQQMLRAAIGNVNSPPPQPAVVDGAGGSSQAGAAHRVRGGRHCSRSLASAPAGLAYATRAGQRCCTPPSRRCATTGTGMQWYALALACTGMHWYALACTGTARHWYRQGTGSQSHWFALAWSGTCSGIDMQWL